MREVEVERIHNDDGQEGRGSAKSFGAQWQSGAMDSRQVEGAQRAYDLAIERIFRDLPEDWGEAAVAIDFGRSPPYRFVAPDGTRWESDVPVTALGEEATVGAASRLQIDIARIWCIEWPSCPAHGGQMKPTVQSGRAVWACDRGDPPVLIGELGPKDA